MIGQINLNSEAGKIIYDIASRSDVETIVEIGTWNGHGSTKCIYEAIKGSSKKLVSFETDLNKYKEALEFYNNKKEVNLCHGYISQKFIKLEELDDSFFSDYSRQIKQTWLDQDIENIKNSKQLINEVPEKFDFLILDGGEFNSYYEYEELKNRCKYIFCDDTRPPCIKNYKTRQDLIINHKILIDNQKDRNGFCLAMTKNE